MSQDHQATRISLAISTTQRTGEMDFNKVSASLERDLAPLENPLDAYRGIGSLLNRAISELTSKPAPAIQSNNVKHESKPAAPPVQTCNKCGAPLKTTSDGKIDWFKEDVPGSVPRFLPKNLKDGSPHRCQR